VSPGFVKWQEGAAEGRGGVDAVLTRFGIGIKNKSDIIVTRRGLCASIRRMGNPAGVKRDFDALEKRRLQAARLLEKGYKEAEVARRVGVHRQSVNRWAREFAQNGRIGLKKTGRAGRKPLLTEDQLRRIEAALQAGSEQAGFETSLWTAAQVGHFIQREFGVLYTKGHVWHLLRQLGWTCRRPVGRAIEKGLDGARRWKKQRGPEAKGTSKKKKA
jgi:transposase